MRSFLGISLLLLLSGTAYAQVPAAPSGLAVAITGQRADLTWTDNATTETYYRVERRTGAAGFLGVKILLANAVRWFDYSVLPSTTYDYRVLACNVPSGCSTASATVAGVIAAAPSATGSLSVPATAWVDEVFIVDARGSTNLCKRPQSDGTPSLTIDVDDGSGFQALIPAFGFAYRTAGVKTLRLNGKNCSGAAITQVTASITISAIPDATGGNSVTLADSGNAATNATNLQTALNNAAAANTVRRDIKLSGTWNTTITGPITLPVPTGSSYIRVYWDGMTVANDKRAVPGDFTGAPTITQPAASPSLPAIGTPSTGTNPPSHHYILDGLKLTRDNPGLGGTQQQYLLILGYDASQQTSLAKIVHHFIVRHLWLDGGTVDTQHIKDGIRSYGNYVSVFDSYAAEFKTQNEADPTAMGVSGGTGPTYWYNNYLVADSENFSVNGTNFITSATISSPSITGMTLSSVADLDVDDNIAVPVGGLYGTPYTAIVGSIAGSVVTFKEPLTNAPDNAGTATWQKPPMFLTFRRNYCYKPLSWRGGVLLVKNLWETKNNRYLVLDGNVLENNWYVQQPFAFVFGSDTADNSPSANMLREVQVSNNLQKNSMTGPNILGSANSASVGGQQNSDFHFRNNLFRAGQGWFVETSNDGMHLGAGRFDGTYSATQVNRFFWIHNTNDIGASPPGVSAFTNLDGPCDVRYGSGALDSMMKNSIHQDGGYGYFVSSVCGSDPATAIKTYLQPGDTTTWDKNLIVNTNGHPYPAAAITQTATWTAQFVNYATGDLTLVGGSPGHNAALDGTDVGVNMTTLNTATANTVSGDWSGRICNWHTSPACN